MPRGELLKRVSSFPWQLVCVTGKYSKIFIPVFLSLNFSLSPSQFKSRLYVLVPQGDIRLRKKKVARETFLNYVFKNLRSLKGRKFDENKHRGLKKHIGCRSFAPKLKERKSPAGGRSAGVRPASWQHSKTDFQLSRWVNGRWDFLPWRTFLFADWQGATKSHCC